MVFNDEFGYWGNAAALAGLDWSSLLAQTPYYSMGYSLLLVPLFWMKLQPEVMYRIAILMNMFFLCVSYCCAVYTAAHLFPEMDRNLCQLVSFASTASGVLLYYSQIAWCEVYLTMLMWCLIALFVRLESKWSLTAVLEIVAVTVLMYLTHQRVVMLVPLAIGMLIIICIRHKRYAVGVFVLIATALCFLGYRYVHSLQVDAVYSASDASNMNKVEVSSSFVGGYLNRIVHDGGRIAVSFICKLGVALLVTGFTLFIAFRRYAEKLYSKKFNYLATETLVVLSVLIMLVLSSIQMYNTSRKDVIVYSRYMDFALPGVTLIGLCELFSNGSHNRKLYLLSFLSIIPLLYLSMNIIDQCENGFNVMCSPIWGSVLWHFGTNRTFVAGGVLLEVSLAFFVLFVLLEHCPTRHKHYIFVCALIVANLLTYNYSNDNSSTIRKNYYKRISGAFETIQDTPDTQVYCLIPTNSENVNGSFQTKLLQSLLYDRPIKYLEKGEKGVYSIADGSYVIIRDDMQNVQIGKHFEPIYGDSDHDLYRYHTGIYVGVNRMYSAVEARVTQEYLKSNGEEGLVICGPYVHLDAGDYSVDLTVKLSGGAVGETEVRAVSGQGGNVLYSAAVMDYLDAENEAVIPIRFSLEEPVDDFEITVWESKGASLKIYPYVIDSSTDSI